MKEAVDAMHLKVLTAEAVVYDAMIQYAEIPLINGGVGILQNHAPMMGAVTEGVLKAKQGDNVEYLAVGQGVVNVAHNEIVLLVRTAERAEDIDMARAAASEKRARERLHDTVTGWDMKRAEVSLNRAMSRLAAAHLAGR